MDNVVMSLVVLSLWIWSILFPFFITDNSKYQNAEESRNLNKARKGTHFLKQ